MSSGWIRIWSEVGEWIQHDLDIRLSNLGHFGAKFPKWSKNCCWISMDQLNSVMFLKNGWYDKLGAITIHLAHTPFFRTFGSLRILAIFRVFPGPCFSCVFLFFNRRSGEKNKQIESFASIQVFIQILWLEHFSVQNSEPLLWKIMKNGPSHHWAPVRPNPTESWWENRAPTNSEPAVCSGSNFNQKCRTSYGSIESLCPCSFQFFLCLDWLLLNM